MRVLMRWIALSMGLACAQVGMAADEPTIVNNPAEKYAMAPGGVDMRTGQYVYSQTDVSIGPESGGLALTRTSPVYVSGHANPFGNFSHNWDIMLVERRIGLTPPMETGPDFRMNMHVGGRSFVFEGAETTSTYGYKSDGPTAILTISGGTKASATVINTVQGPDGTLYEFRPMGNLDCAVGQRCAFVSKITQPDGTVLNFNYAYDAGATGNRARLTRVTSSRGYVLMLQWSSTAVAEACVINAATTTPPAGTNCPAGALATATYSYTTGKLTTVTTPDNAQWQFTYAAATYGSLPATIMGFKKPGIATAWLTNKYYVKNDEEGVPHDIVYEQNFSDGRIYSYAYDLAPYTTNKPIPSIAGGSVTDGQGNSITYQYAWPILPGSRERICRFPPCGLPMPDDEYKYTYQQTSSPALIVDELQRETKFDYCDPVVWAGLPVQEIDRCALIKNYSYTLPEGGTGPTAQPSNNTATGRVEFDPYGNVSKTTIYPKTVGLAPIETSAAYELTNPKAATKPKWRKDGNGNQTDWTYDAAHGGVLSETGPAVNGVRPQKRYAYAQRYAWIRSGASYVQAATPVWLLSSESFCRSSAWTGSACSTAGDEVVTSYDYGPNSGPNNLLLRGTAVTADGVTRRTCFGYDAMGRKISETTANANLTSCP